MNHPTPTHQGNQDPATSADARTDQAHPPSAWKQHELADDPHRNQHKAQKVRDMFAAIARSYDINNRLHSFGRDQAWRRAAVRAANLQPTDHVLDVACGTGDLTRAFAHAGAQRTVGLDYTPQMLDIARTKRSKPADEHIDYLEGDAMALPFDDRSFDVLSIAFGIRNVAEPPKALAEFRRVLRPNGRLVILEFDTPRFPPARWASKLYTDRIMPLTATLVARDTSGAYRYLPRSVSTFMTRGQLNGAITDAGFLNTRNLPQTFGICTIYAATSPA